jgi:hypothetical protein
MDGDTIIIGYFAASKRGDVVCDGPACIIAGSYKTMKLYLAEPRTKPPGKVKITKTRFGEIVSGMRMGGAYSFDEESYGRFLPLAREEGMRIEDLDFTPDNPGEIKFVTIAQTMT